MQPIRTVTLEAGRLTAALDNLADVPAAIERHAAGHGPLDDPDKLIAMLRGVIADFAFDLHVAAHFRRHTSADPAVTRAPPLWPSRTNMCSCAGVGQVPTM